MSYTFAIYDETDTRIFTAQYATTEAEALDEYAGYRSGYDTFTEMAQSRVYQDVGACNVSARATT